MKSALTLYGIMAAFTFVILQTASARADTATLTVVGEAYNPETGKLLYRELHYQANSSTYSTIEYRAPNHQPIAIKTLDFSEAAIAPAFEQLNQRTGQLVSASPVGEQLQLGFRQGLDDQLQTQAMAVKQPLVVDAGFDNFVRQQWNALASGEPVRFAFAVPTRLSTITLKAKRRACPAMRVHAEAVCFRIKPENWLVAALLQPIDLQYHPQSRRLLAFNGVSNLHDAQGNTMQVSIRYRYPDASGDMPDPVNSAPASRHFAF